MFVDHTFEPSTMSFTQRDADVIVVGGGLAGLIAAAKVAQAEHSVIVLEQARHFGGRAATQVKSGLHLNLGPHALYCQGHAFRLLKELHVPFSGRFPNPGRSVLLQGKNEFAFPFSAWSLLTSGLFSLREKWILARLLQELPRMDVTSLTHVSLQTWIEQRAGRGNLNAFLRTLARLNTYADAAETLSAAAALTQLQVGLSGNVWYVDGGWQTLIDGLRSRASEDGTEFRTGSSVKRVERVGNGIKITLANGEELHSRAAILTVSPGAACQLLNLSEESPLARWSNTVVPVHAACLDVCLDRLSRPEHRFALGLDRSVYYSVHSAAAKLAPEGIAVVHIMKYLREDAEKSYSNTEAELEGVLDQMQPGWRAQVVERRFLPGMTVSHCLPAAAQGGTVGRPGVQVQEQPGVFLAGDWVGSRGTLADASAASAEDAANCVLNSFKNESQSATGSFTHVGN
ncbi:MAG: crtN [Planctomycetaceae bacterium]|nr:crtN [Planctomycetaceae bacterium]